MDGALDGVAVGGTVGLENVAAQTEQRGAAVALGVDALLEGAEGGLGQQGAGGAHRVGLKLLAQHGGEEFHERFPALEHDVADEAVADDHVDVLGKHLETLDGTGVVDQAVDAAEQFVGLGDQGAALALLGADVHEADAGRLDAEHDPAIVAAENGVVHEVLGLGLGIGAGVDQDKVAVFARHDGGEGGAGDALHGAQAQSAAGHEGAGVAAADDDAGVAVADELNGADHRGVLLALEGHQRLVVHRDDLGRVMNGDVVAAVEAGGVDQRAEDRLVPDQGHGIERRVLPQGEFDGLNDLGGAHVAAHGVDRYAPGIAGRSAHREDGGACGIAGIRPRR